MNDRNKTSTKSTFVGGNKIAATNLRAARRLAYIAIRLIAVVWKVQDQRKYSCQTMKSWLFLMKKINNGNRFHKNKHKQICFCYKYLLWLVCYTYAAIRYKISWHTEQFIYCKHYYLNINIFTIMRMLSLKFIALPRTGTENYFAFKTVLKCFLPTATLPSW